MAAVSPTQSRPFVPDSFKGNQVYTFLYANPTDNQISNIYTQYNNLIQNDDHKMKLLEQLIQIVKIDLSQFIGKDNKFVLANFTNHFKQQSTQQQSQTNTLEKKIIDAKNFLDVYVIKKRATYLYLYIKYKEQAHEASNIVGQMQAALNNITEDSTGKKIITNVITPKVNEETKNINKIMEDLAQKISSLDKYIDDSIHLLSKMNELELEQETIK